MELKIPSLKNQFYIRLHKQLHNFVAMTENRIRQVFRERKEQGKTVTVAGPMVRYSKLPFRALVRHFDCDVVYSPMMLAREFCRNQTARLCDFTTNKDDFPLIVQLGGNNAEDMVKAVKMLQPYVDGVGINCGCPIKEQIREGVGAALMTAPDLVAEMVAAIRKECGAEIYVEVKMRIHKDLNDTVHFAKLVEAAGADSISVHGRLVPQRSRTAPNYDGIKIVKDSVDVPVIANGDAFTTTNIEEIVELTGCDGVMAARGILSNPAMFAGYTKTPWRAVELFWDYVTAYGLPYALTIHHFSEMLEAELTRYEKKDLNNCKNMVELINWFDDRFDLKRPGDEDFAIRDEYPWKNRTSFVYN
ncbi:YALI0E26059p [Yarrowia lipolytica CLIB122]|uniref:tRNA-dihydrouridine synthase n=3 Tax=Yarrowia lipolytica TaxID=4952 RepID=Q6C4K2_YARLI|nr:YALI0E26059p [Yarrowia lipolytica CLIB122]KAJ8057385.1 hypothetical protein LXG23DRAFT_46718 [Yarrowia lipolytica]CAG80011.1 YALI0E26059p [Yarrowia lipolytica CLIB122]SEI33421.1 YALIA101S03e17920g1_1 [Yarrowia lipolytica]VBB77862.1 Conserved hypothetical protein [Yarrowia lipolytica]|eukprot:XP_504410.1 YALI0E26059p [Yarrowia lipolytica CLIB122]